MTNPIDGFQVSKADLRFIGNDLYRPECILPTRDGSLWCADSRGGVQKISPDGMQRLISDNKNQNTHQNLLTGTDLPNGICFSKDGSIYIANQGKRCLELMDMDGKRKTVLDSIEGEPIGVINFPLRDSKDRIWISVSTRHDVVTEVMRQIAVHGKNHTGIVFRVMVVDMDTEIPNFQMREVAFCISQQHRIRRISRAGRLE